MSKYDKRKFYWLQLKEDFFENDTISWLEEQENGEKYALFYIKLCLKSLKSNGILIRKIGDNYLIPYDDKKLAELTNTKNIDTVHVAMLLLKKIGLIKILDNGAIYLPLVQDMIGEKSMGAFKKEQQRLLAKKNNDVLLIAQEEDKWKTDGGQMSANENGGQKVDKCPPSRKRSYIKHYSRGGQMSTKVSTRYRYRYR